MKLDNKVALITGAAQGIGFGIATRFVPTAALAAYRRSRNVRVAMRRP